MNTSLEKLDKLRMKFSNYVKIRYGLVVVVNHHMHNSQATDITPINMYLSQNVSLPSERVVHLLCNHIELVTTDLIGFSLRLDKSSTSFTLMTRLNTSVLKVGMLYTFQTLQRQTTL